MSKTKHFGARMNQRAIQQTLIDLTLEYGVDQGDKTVLNRKALSSLLDQLEKLKSETQRAIQKGGVAVVESDGKLITAYSLNSYRRPH